MKVDDLRFPGLIAAEAHGRVLLTATTIADIAREAHTWGRPAARAATVAGDLVEQMLAAIDQQVVPRDSSVAELIRRGAKRMLSDTVVG